jgi:hypothetical protein
MVYSEIFHYYEFNNYSSYHQYASETSFSRMENAFSNIRNAVSGPEKKNRARMWEETNSPSLMATSLHNLHAPGSGPAILFS